VDSEEHGGVADFEVISTIDGGGSGK